MPALGLNYNKITFKSHLATFYVVKCGLNVAKLWFKVRKGPCQIRVCYVLMLISNRSKKGKNKGLGNKKGLS